jgi:hypothetical protein
MLLILASFILVGCNSSYYSITPAENVAVTPPVDPVIDTTIDIGDSYEGGIYAGEINGYALVATPGNCNTDISPTCDGSTDSVSYQFWDARSFCEDLEYSGQTDWYLPNQDEVSQMQTHHSLIGGFFISATQGYWTSHQYYYSEWYVLLFDGAGSQVFYDYDPQFVRCVRQAPVVVN